MAQFFAVHRWLQGIVFNFLIPVMPFPDTFTEWSDFTEIVAPNSTIRMLGTWPATLDSCGQIPGHQLPTDVERISIRESPHVMMLGMIYVFPNQITIPIVFADETAATMIHGTILFAFLADQQVTVFKELREATIFAFY